MITNKTFLHKFSKSLFGFFLAVVIATSLCESARAADSFKTEVLGGVETRVWLPASEGSAPLLIFSHGFLGAPAQSKFLMDALVAHGYIVVAPEHADARSRGLSTPAVPFRQVGQWSDKTYADRRDDIVHVLAALHADPQWNKRIDWSRCGVLGHSLGGYTALGLVGAWTSWKVPEFKAALALSPYCAPYTFRNRLQYVQVPVMYQGGTDDVGITPTVKRENGAYDQTHSPAYFIELSGANHMAWTNYDNDRTLKQAISDYSVAFFDRYLRDDKSAEAVLQKKLKCVSTYESK